jgi:hypothetical protein
VHSENKSSNNPVSTSAQLRHGITTGRARDKVSNIDPAAAPLGTDDEAGGNPPSREQIEQAAQQELKSDSVPSQPLELSSILMLLGAAAFLMAGLWIGVLYARIV